jgi:YHS domain-containing protein
MDPKKFKTNYMGTTNYACATSTKAPFRYRWVREL